MRSREVHRRMAVPRIGRRPISPPSLTSHPATTPPTETVTTTQTQTPIPDALPRLVLKPQPGPQSDFLASSADIAIYGGAAGGGKTFGLLLEPLRHITTVKGYGAVIFRRTSKQVRNEGGMWDESFAMYPHLGAL